MLRRVKGRRGLRAPGASELTVVRRVSERGLTRRRKMRGEKEVTVYGESHFEGRKGVKRKERKEL